MYVGDSYGRVKVVDETLFSVILYRDCYLVIEEIVDRWGGI